ncbi:MAG: phosphoribosylformylglycinamidine cyclo-ligase [Calditrichaeota bacterium]|nr:MAG: phosphoribosylformylglycinamidine cyclo-ligase [Calditrichota bacterium]
MSKPITYKDAGVDIEKAESALSRLKQRIARTHTPEVLTGIGLFGGFYDLSGLGLSEPVLVASTDGVGTKLKVAMMAGRHDTVGQDLVHHCINDIAVCGAQPLFFLDYFATGILEPSVYEAVISGIAHACENAGIPLIGGETAEMPDFYAPGEYDLCGTIVGAVEKSRIIDGSNIAPGDVLVGVAGNGLHTNGYTLARKVLFSHYSLDAKVEELGCSLADELLKIHPNYYPVIRRVVETVEVHGIAHITGGGIEKNTRRLLREGLNLRIDWGSWPVPPIFGLIQRLGRVPEEDMRQTFNLGIGLVVVVAPEQMALVMETIEQAGHSAHPIGNVLNAR